MTPLVHVPHRRSLPTTQIGNRYGFEVQSRYFSDDLEEAHALVSQEFQDYAGSPNVQEQLIADAMDDLAFSREVGEAAQRISDIVVKTQSYDYQGISVKDETQQLTKAYKIRGATNFILKYADVAHEAGVITASAGNHGQAVALAASKIGVEAIVVVPEGTPTIKKDGIESHGGRVIVYGRDYAAADNRAHELNISQKGLYAPAYNDRDIMAGQATMGFELLDQLSDLTDLVVPTGGGGALAGLAKYFRAAAPDVRLWGSGISNKSAVQNALQSGNHGLSQTCRFADGIAVTKLGSQTWPEIKRSVTGALTVEEVSLRRLVGELSLTGRVVEGAGAVGLAASLEHRRKLGTKPVTIATGGNIDETVLRACQLLAMASPR
jgi:threonine dehydratase